MADTIAYADLDDLFEALEEDRAGASEIRLARMQSALVDGAEFLNGELETDFYRHPATGTEVRLLNGSGTDVLHVHAGIVSLTQVRIRTSRTAAWVTLAETDYDLETRTADDPNQSVAAIWPFDHVRLNGTGSYSRWPKGHRLVEFTGAFGWPASPRRAVLANVALARQFISADRSLPGGTISYDEAGRPILPSRLPDAVYRLKAWWSGLYYSCDV